MLRSKAGAEGSASLLCKRHHVSLSAEHSALTGSPLLLYFKAELYYGKMIKYPHR